MARIRELPRFVGYQPVLECIQRQVGRSRRRRRGTDIEQAIVDVGAVVRRVVTAAAAATTRVDSIELRLTSRDLRAPRVVVAGPRVEERERADAQGADLPR